MATKAAKKTLTIDDLNDTQVIVLRYMAQEPRAFVIITRTPAGRSILHVGHTDADVYDQSGSRVYFPLNSVKTVSLAAMPNTGLLTEIERPVEMRETDTLSPHAKLYRLTEAGRILGMALVDSYPRLDTPRKVAAQFVIAAQYGAIWAKSNLERAQKDFRDAEQKVRDAEADQARLEASLCLTLAQEVARNALLSAPGDALLIGDEDGARAILRRITEDNDGAYYLEAKRPIGQEVALRPTILCVPAADTLIGYDAAIRSMRGMMRDGGRMICSAKSAKHIEEMGLIDPLCVTLCEEDC